MSISAINAVTDSGGLEATSTSSLSQAPPLAQPQELTTLSPPALLLSGLQRLAEVDPSRLSDIATVASQKLRAAAATASGTTSQRLSGLADAFDQIAATGDVSALHVASTGRKTHHHAGGYPSVSSAVTGSSDAQSTLAAVSEEVEQALGMNPPPYGPWGNSQ